MWALRVSTSACGDREVRRGTAPRRSRPGGWPRAARRVRALVPQRRVFAWSMGLFAGVTFKDACADRIVSDPHTHRATGRAIKSTRGDGRYTATPWRHVAHDRVDDHGCPLHCSSPCRPSSALVVDRGALCCRQRIGEAANMPPARVVARSAGMCTARIKPQPSPPP